MKKLTLHEINEKIHGKLVGSTTELISGAETIGRAQKSHITFIGSPKYVRLWKSSNASIAIIKDTLDCEPGENKALIKVKNPDLAMVKILKLFDPGTPEFDEDIHPTAFIHERAKIGKGCKIGAGCFIGSGVELEENVKIFPNVTILNDSKVGVGTVIWPGTVIRERSKIGAYCILHLNVSIGADGFGYRPSEDGTALIKIPQIGDVVIGNHVEIGAGTCIDRGKFSSTIIGDGCKIDNLVQIAHNCILGRSCIIAGNCGLAGSVTLGDGVIIGGGASIKDHITIHSGARIGACSGVIKDVPAGKTVVGSPAYDAQKKLKQWVALRKLAEE